MSSSESTPAAALGPRHLLVVAGLLPAVIAAATYLVMWWLAGEGRSLMEVTLGFGFFVLEVGLVGTVVGHAMPHPLLRWLLFGWLMVLIDLLVGSSAMLSSHGHDIREILPAAALVAGQIGLAIIWGTLGTARWYWRAPFTLAAGAGLLGLWIFCVTGWSGRLMTQVLVVQAITLTLITIGLRVRGYRLIQLDLVAGNAAGANRRFQFGVRDVLIWTTVLAILLGLMRAADMLRWKSLSEHPSLFLMSTVALLSAMAIVLALWASLGQGHWLLRYSLLVVMLLGLGAVMGAACTYGEWLLDQWRRTQTSPYRFYDWDLHRWYKVGWWWIAWMFLSGGLLAASLMIFRAVGYRLVREGATRPPAAPSGA